MALASDSLTALDEQGVWLARRAVAEPALGELESRLPAGRAAGRRLAGMPWLADWIMSHLLPVLERDGISPGLMPVRAILFDKTVDTNWSLGWHQDRTVAVRQRLAVDGYGPWSVKQGLQHVEPPFAVMQRMLTARLHLDPVDNENGPLRVALGSHRLGKIADAVADQAAEALPELTCLAGRGDVWLYATPILHASAASVRPRSRRVLQLDLAPDSLPDGVEWLGVA